MERQKIYMNWLTYGSLSLGLLLMVVCTVKVNITMGLAIGCVPLVLLYAYLLLVRPHWGLITLFTLNYFIIPIMKYTYTEGLSVLVDIMIVLTFAFMIINTITSDKIKWGKVRNSLTLLALVWFLFCCIELVNPTAMPKAWLLSRGLTYYFLAITVLTFILFDRYTDLKRMLYLWSVFTLLGALKGIMQQKFGFDPVEAAWLNGGGAKTHLLLTGTRYFSFYVSAGVFGATMGHSLVVFFIAAFYIKNNWSKAYFLFVASLALYGLLLSGTRGAIAVPLSGFALWIILSKRIGIIVPGAIALIMVYFFLAHTFIGQGNSYIRRMRTAFDPNEPSLVVRKENQKLFRAYLHDKPFGEGLGLSGIDAQNISTRYTTSIPTDSWYVKIWVETGIVGLLLHIGIFIYFLAHGAYLVMFQIKDKELQGLLSALLCGIFGILVSSYGNQVLGQYPTVFLVYTSMAFVFAGKTLDQEITNNQIITTK